MAFLIPIAAAIGAGAATYSAVEAGTLAAVALAATSVAAAGVSIASTIQGNTNAALASAGVAVGTGIAAVSGIPSTSTETGAISQAGSAAGAISSAASSVTGTTSGAVATIGDVLSNIGSTAASLAQDIKDFASPIIHVIDQITSVFTAIQDDVVKPVQELVTGTAILLDQIPAEFDALAKAGISGLGTFATSLGNTLASADAQFGRAIQQLGSANLSTVKDALVPGLGEAGLTALPQIHAVLNSFSLTTMTDVGTLATVPLSEPQAPADLLQMVQTLANDAKNETGFWGPIDRFIIKLIQVVPIVAAAQEPMRNVLLQTVLKDLGPELLPVNAALEAYYRKALTEAQFVEELQRQGLNQSRIALLVALRQWLPTAREAVELEARGAISTEDGNTILSSHGFTADDMTAYRFAFYEPVGPREYIGARARVAAGAAGFLAASYGGQPPADVLDKYPPRFRKADQAEADWIEHWRTPGMSWWITAYFRGFRTRSEVEQAAAAENIPPEVIPDLISVEQDVIQLWMIPDMLATGLFTDQEALDYLAYIGLAPRDAALIVKYGDAKKKAPAAGVASALAGISAANAKTMYDDGIITGAEYTDVLIAHKYSAEAAALTVQLADQTAALAKRKQDATDIVNQANAGQITDADAISSLYSLGYTDAEVAGYALKLKQLKTASAKRFTDADLKSLWKHGLIQDADAVSGLQGNGWGASDAALLLTLWKAGG